MPTETAPVIETEVEKPTAEIPADVSETAEATEPRLNFLANVRQKLTNELKLTFTLPDPRKEGIVDTAKNLWLKGSGLAGVYVGKALFMAGEQGHILHNPGETAQAFHRGRELAETGGVGVAALGALSIFLANRLRDKQEDDR